MGAALELPVSIDPALWELHFGVWEGRSWAEIAAGDGARMRRWMEHWRGEAPPGGERVVDLEARVERWWLRLAPGGQHLLVAHAGVIRALRVVVREMEWEEAMATEVPHLALESFALAPLGRRAPGGESRGGAGSVRSPSRQCPVSGRE